MGSSAGPAKKASQLSQLKQSLKQSGLSRVNSGGAFNNSKNKTRSSTSSHVKDPEFRKKKLAEIQASQNLFDLKTSNVKFPTSFQLQKQRAINGSIRLSQQTKAIRTVGKPTQSATQAHQRRVEKLLPEYLNRHKSSQFLDKRFGEGDSTLTPEEKALERFTKERQSRSTGAKKRSVFNLDDEGEGLYDDGEFGDNVPLTHGGRDLEFENDPGDDDNDDDPESIFQSRAALIDGQLDESSGQERDIKKKTKAEVMSEIITKSKAHKYQRQMIKEKDDELRDNLNEELNQIRSLLLASQPPAPADLGKSASKRTTSDISNPQAQSTDDVVPTVESAKSSSSEQAPVGVNPQVSHGSKVDRDLLEALIGSSSSAADSEAENGVEDAYDRFVRELAFDARAKPSDRLKTAEELALEEAERLRQLELRRLKRMRGDDDDDEDTRPGKASDKNRKKRKPEADDLEDDFFPVDEALDTESNLSYDLRPDGAFGAGASAQEQSEDSTNDSQSSDSSEEDDASSESSDDNDPYPSNSKEFQPLVSTTPSSEILKIPKSKKNELAFTYPCPTSHVEFLSILSSASVESSDLPTVIQRIKVLHHPSLDEGNKEKLARFTSVLIDHIIYLSSQPLSTETAFFNLINGLLPHLIGLCKSYTQTSASHFVSKLVLMHKNLNYALADPERCGWPGASELILLRLIGLLWSTSDFSHPVAAPALLLMNQYLTQLRVKRFTDLMTGIFLCTLILQYESQSRRFVPEVINFLVVAVLRMTCEKEKNSRTQCLIPILEGTRLVLFPIQGGNVNKLSPKTMDFANLFGSNTSLNEATCKASDQDLINALDVIISLLKNFSDLYGSLNLFPEVFSQVLAVIEAVDSTKLCEETKVRVAELIDSVKTKIEGFNRMRSLNPLRLQSHKPIPIKSQTPQFDPQFNPNQKKFNPDSNQVEINKLKSLVKKEKKGAIRELRKDNRFLAMAQAKEKEVADADYKAKMARISASLQEERAEEKKQDRLKLRLKKLDKARRGK